MGGEIRGAVTEDIIDARYNAARQYALWRQETCKVQVRRKHT